MDGIGCYNVNEMFFIGVIDKGNFEIRDCVLLQFLDDNCVRIKLDNRIEDLIVPIGFLKAKRRWVDKAIDLDS